MREVLKYKICRRGRYKLLVDPTTFAWFLIEIKGPPITKRRVEPSELLQYTENEFRFMMAEYGYGGFCTQYIKQESVEFALNKSWENLHEKDR